MADQNFLDNDVGCLARADDHDRNAVVPVLVPVLQAPEKPVGEAARENAGDQEEGVQEIIAVGHGLRLPAEAEKPQDHHVGDAGQNTGDDQILQLRLAGKSPE